MLFLSLSLYTSSILPLFSLYFKIAKEVPPTGGFLGWIFSSPCSLLFQHRLIMDPLIFAVGQS